MGTQVATILGQTPLNGNTSDLTHPSLTEDVQFGIFLSNGDEGGGLDGTLSSIGIWARDSNQLCQASFGQDDVPRTEIINGHVDRNDAVAFRSTLVDGEASRVRAFVDEPISNGVRIASVVHNAAPRNIPIGAMLFAGADVKAQVHQVQVSRVVGQTTLVNPGIDGLSVDMIVALTSTDIFNGSTHGGFTNQTVSFHTFEDEVKQSSIAQTIAWRSSNNTNSFAPHAIASGLVVANGNHVQSDPSRHPDLAAPWEFSIDVVDGLIRIETIRAGDENSDPEFGLLVAHLGGDRATAGLMSTPASPSDDGDAVNATFSPSIDSNLKGLLLQLNNVSTVGVDLIDSPMAGHYGMAMISSAPASDRFSSQSSWDADADPTNALTTQGDFLSVQSDDGSLAVVGEANIVDNNLSVTFTDSQTFHFPFLAIVEGPPEPDPDPDDGDDDDTTDSDLETRLTSIEQTLAELAACPKPIVEDPDNPGEFVLNPIFTPIVDLIQAIKVDTGEAFKSGDIIRVVVVPSSSNPEEGILTALHTRVDDGTPSEN